MKAGVMDNPRLFTGVNSYAGQRDDGQKSPRCEPEFLSELRRREI